MGDDHDRRQPRHRALLIVFFIFQRQIIKGIALTGLKG
jgi:hypothetical protein